MKETSNSTKNNNHNNNFLESHEFPHCAEYTLNTYSCVIHSHIYNWEKDDCQGERFKDMLILMVK